MNAGADRERGTARRPVAARAWAAAALLSLPCSPPIAGAAEEAPASVTESSGGARAPDASIEVIEVPGERESLPGAAWKFVARITHGDDEHLARWRDAICPTVSGVTPENGEFVRLRILEIARESGARVARDSTCRSNLIVAITSKPDEVLAGWRASNPRAFGAGSKTGRDDAAPMPVRIWYSAALNNADGSPPKEFANSAPQYRLKDSRIASSVAEDISAVVVLVDTNGTGTVSFGQLADYVAMASLARVDLNADLAGFATILRLFAPHDPDRAPAALTDWDRAFLAALYEPPTFEQRAHMAASMAKRLAR